MKKLNGILKNFMIGFILTVLIFPSNANAANTGWPHYGSYSVQDFVKYAGGNWYDTKGRLALTISDDYKLNGCTIVSVQQIADTVAMYKVRIDEGNRYRDIELMREYAKSSEHDTLTVNWRDYENAYSLRRTKEPRYFESIGGIYIGMDKDEVLRLYGQPSKIEDDRGRHKTLWKYSADGFEVSFSRNIVGSITIYANSDRRLDWSGLSANDDISVFSRIYNPPSVRKHAMYIGHGELVYVYDDRVILCCCADSAAI